MLVRLEFDTVTPSQNVWDRLSRSRVRLISDWRKMVTNAYIKGGRVEFPEPIKGEKRIVRIAMRSPRRYDESNWRGPFNKLVTDRLRRRVQRKVQGQMVWVEGEVPVLWDDDPEHCDEVLEWSYSKTPGMTVEVWRFADWEARK